MFELCSVRLSLDWYCSFSSFRISARLIRSLISLVGRVAELNRLQKQSFAAALQKRCFEGKHLHWFLFLITAWRSATLSRRDSSTSVFQWNLRNFEEQPPVAASEVISSGLISWFSVWTISKYFKRISLFLLLSINFILTWFFKPFLQKWQCVNVNWLEWQ